MNGSLGGEDGGIVISSLEEYKVLTVDGVMSLVEVPGRVEVSVSTTSEQNTTHLMKVHDLNYVLTFLHHLVAGTKRVTTATTASNTN